MAEILQADSVRLTWDDMNNRTKTSFKPPNRDILRVTLKPSSLILILKHNRPICHRQLTLPVSASQVSAGILDMYRPTYRSTCWLTLGQVLTDISIDMSTNSRPI